MPKRSKFWVFRAAAEERVGELLLYGPIDSATWYGDEVTPKQFKADLDALGDVTLLRVFINSPGGDVFASQAIYSMLKRHSARVEVYIDGLAASGASIVAMAGDTAQRHDDDSQPGYHRLGLRRRLPQDSRRA
jgi:ATP-dependent Clp protease protease subunit